MKKSLILTLILVSFLGCFRQTKDPASERDTLAVVGAFYVLNSDFDRELAYLNENSDDPLIKSRTYDALVEEVLILNSLLNASQNEPARPLGEYADPQKRKEAVSILLEEKVYSKIELSPEESESYYATHKEEFIRKSGVLLRQMTLGGGRLKNEAMDLLHSGHSFEDVARLYSISPDRGKSQYFENSELPEYLAPVVIGLKEGQVSQPIEISRDTYQVILLEKRERNFILPLDMVRQMIRLHLSDSKGEKLRKDFIESLRKSYNIRLFCDRLQFKYVKENE
jgi:hypothetical protein